MTQEMFYNFLGPLRNKMIHLKGLSFQSGIIYELLFQHQYCTNLVLVQPAGPFLQSPAYISL